MPDNRIDTYIHAATRDNTRRSYRSALKHFEETWGGLLPASEHQIARYLADFAGKLSVNTLKNRLAALGQWHLAQGFVDPTKTPMVRKVLKGITALHPRQIKQAPALLVSELRQVVDELERRIGHEVDAHDTVSVLRARRDKALILIGFWRAFRSDELVRLRFEHINVQPGHGMILYLPRSKTHHSHQGVTYSVPALATLCPVQALEQWQSALGCTSGPVFRAISRWGHVSDTALNVNSVRGILQQRFNKLSAQPYTSHSLRRGFATWAHLQQWDLKTLMEYVGWKDMQSAGRYIVPLGERLLIQQSKSLLPVDIHSEHDEP